MEIKQLTSFFSVSAQLGEVDVAAAATAGFKTLINNRPDDEAEAQPGSATLAAAAERSGIDYLHLPVTSSAVSDEDVAQFTAAMAKVRGPVLAFCQSGLRPASLWALSEAWHLDIQVLLKVAGGAGYDLAGLEQRLAQRARKDEEPAAAAAEPARRAVGLRHDVVVVGGGAGGLAVAASLLRRDPLLDIAVIEPHDKHYYQPGWTLVGAGVFERADTERSMAAVMPKGAHWIRGSVVGFEPTWNEVILENGARVGYRVLIAAPGIKLHWEGVEGLVETLGRNGVTSNYKFEMASYTRQLVENLSGGRALFTQPLMPIKCAGAPQKAMYLSCDMWSRRGVLDDVEIEFHNAGGVLFAVPEYVPALMDYVTKYGARLCFNQNLISVDGAAKVARFERTDEDGSTEHIEREFDIMHVCPPQTAPDFVANSELAGDGGWLEVDQQTLQHTRFGNVFALGDACSTPNAKTAAAARKQAPVVAENTLAVLAGLSPHAAYDGYGSCPLTVERGKIVLAEFGYGGKLLPTFPHWLLDGRKPTRRAWFLKEKVLPWVYWECMLKGREWLVAPESLPHAPAGIEARQSAK